MIILRNLNPKPFFRTDPILSRLSLSSRPDLTAAPFSQTSPELYCRGPGFNGASMLDYITSLVPCRVTYRITAMIDIGSSLQRKDPRPLGGSKK